MQGLGLWKESLGDWILDDKRTVLGCDDGWGSKSWETNVDLLFRLLEGSHSSALLSITNFFHAAKNQLAEPKNLSKSPTIN